MLRGVEYSPMKFAVLDFETTGSETHDRIIQIGLSVIENGVLTGGYSSFVQAGAPLPESIVQLTGIDDEMLADAPELDEAVIGLLPHLRDAVLVAHNAPFDVAFMQRALNECGYEPFAGRVLDTLVFLRFLYPHMSSLQLGRVCSELGIPLERPHRADCDAEATAHVWLACLERLQHLPLLTLQRLHGIFATSPALEDTAWFLEAVKDERELQPWADEQTSGHPFRQFQLAVGEWETAASTKDAAEEARLDGNFEQFYDEFKALLQRTLANYEDRQAQERMIREVHEAFVNDEHLLVEAGTGTGKSLGYLIPSIFYSLAHGEKVVVSTHTINLQEQLRERDIPLLQQLFPVPFRAAVLKGRSHYLCLRKFEHKMNALDFDDGREETIVAAQMVVWLGQTASGDEEELHLANKGLDFWRSVESDADSCLNRACPWFKRCFYHRARQEANASDVLITNHSLLFTDVKAEHRLLPSYRQLVIDEAHQFEETASKHLGITVNYFGLVKTILRLYKDNRTGLLPQLAFRLSHDGDAEQWEEEVHALEACMPELLTVKEDWDALAEAMFGLLSVGGDPLQSEGGQYVKRIDGNSLPLGWEHVVELEDALYGRISGVLKKLDKAALSLKEKAEEHELQGLVTDLSGLSKELLRLRDSLRFTVRCNEAEYVYWMEASPNFRSKSLQLSAVPIDVSPLLRQHFFDNKESVVLTSATLSVEKSFQYACEQLGLQTAEEEGRLRTVQLPAAFNYREQALVCVPRDFPSVRGSGDARFIEALAGSLTDVAEQTKGRMLVLFTSYRMLKQVYELMQEPLMLRGVQLLGQGIDSTNRSKLIRLFQEQSATVLLGTSSFWEGVDIPGQALTCLAIVRLPFQPPNHPLTEAKNDALKRINKNPFMKLSVPQAVIRFKQGFGRLVRTAQDKGVVIIYDTRVIDTAYGKHFLYSLPGPKIEHLPTSRLVGRIGEWLDYHKLEGSS